MKTRINFQTKTSKQKPVQFWNNLLWIDETKMSTKTKEKNWKKKNWKRGNYL